MSLAPCVTGSLLSTVEGALTGWLPAQRWFGAKDRPVCRVELSAPAVLTDRLADGGPAGIHLVAAVYLAGADGHSGRLSVEHYQVPVGVRSDLPAALEPALITRVDGLSVYDATADGELTGVLLDLIDRGEDRDGLRFRREPVAARLIAGGSVPPGRRGTAEQSNTSVVFADRYILKLFRRLSVGANSDVVLHRALGAAGSAHIAPVLGVIDGTLAGSPVTYGMLQRFAAGSVDGWSMATDSVRALIAGGPDAADGFAVEAARLGAAVAAVHTDLAGRLGTDPLRAPDLARIRDTMLARLHGALRVVPSLALYRTGLLDAFDALLDPPTGLWAQRIHNDLHLGQVLRTGERWLLIDFEGEPAATPTERTARHSPLRDVAGMLRSLDYAAHATGTTPAAGPDPRADRWATRNGAAFRRGYAAAAGIDLAPLAGLLRAYELDKAVYEAVYEARNRPEWLPIPLYALDRLLGGAHA